MCFRKKAKSKSKQLKNIPGRNQDQNANDGRCAVREVVTGGH